ncbi:MAG: AIR synthase related protein [Desulfitobacteriaceae bacterium]|nr:AIR synthase related protein [Desulfitobacteriaceae bacterium]
MSKEKEMIDLINRHMPRSPKQINQPFQADAEIIQFMESTLLYNIDEFSEEDLFRDNDPYVLGWNMAAGTISDILASGGSPKFYAHSLTACHSWGENYLELLARGIGAVLKETGTAFIGGDFGVSSVWRYTGSVIGELNGSPLLRNEAKIGEKIFLSGPVGRGNLEAALKIYADHKFIKKMTGTWKNYFPLRYREAEIIKKYSRCCIDTSDGVFNALNTISEMSGTGFVVNRMPYIKSGLMLAKALHLPEEMMFFGECGEYELLFTVSRENEAAFFQEAENKKMNFYPIGAVAEEGKKILRGKAGEIDLTGFNLKARDYAKIKEYVRDLADFLKRRPT